jgi:uncharacterized membrane-anchored protein
MSEINDGTGSGYKMKVNRDNRAEVSAAVEPRQVHNSRKHKRAFSWTAVSADIDAGDTALWLANISSTLQLCITKIYMWADTATQFKIHCPAYPATPAGTLVVGNNLNRTANELAEALCYADETANAFAAANVVKTVRNNEVGTDQEGIEVTFDGSLILGYRNCIAVDIIAESAAFECTIEGYYDEPEV